MGTVNEKVSESDFVPLRDYYYFINKLIIIIYLSLFLVMILKMRSILVNHTNSVFGEFRNHRTKFINNIKILSYE